MKKIGNKILSLFLAMVLVLGLALVTTYAAGHTDHKVCSKATAHAVGETCSHETITTAQWEPLVIPAVKEGEDYPILESGYYYLAENITTDSNVMLAKDAEVVICLNGKTWNLRSGEYDGSLYLNENVDLKICDCSSTQAGKLDGCVNVYGGNPKLVELYSGEINCLNSASSSSVISTFNMYGGKINIDTMEEEARREWNSRAIYLYGNNSDVNINIYGGTIIGDDAGIYMSKVSSNSALNIYGGTIEGIIYGLELNSDEGIVNICGNANIIGRTRAIVSSRPSNGNGCKLKISGSPTIDGSYGWAAIETYNTIEIEGTPTIRNYVRCYPHPYGDAAEPYPMFRITGAFTPKQAIDVYVEYPNLTIAEGWSNVGSGATVSSYFKASSSSSVSVRSLKVDEANSDQLMAAPSSSSVQAKTNAIAFPNGNTISVQAGDATATLDTLKSYDASRFTVKVYDADKALVNNVGGTVSGTTLSLTDAGNLQSGTYYEKDAEVESTAPITEATLNNTKDELIAASNIFTVSDKTLIELGVDARVWLEIGKTDESTIAAEDKAKIEGAATEIMGEDAKVTYFDADLFKKVGAGSKSKVSEPGVGIKITIIIPEELLNHDKTMAREYKIIRLHEGAVEVISGEFNAETREFTFETDKFSTYAIAYGDTPVNEKAPVVESPKTGEQNMATYAFALVLMSGLGILFYERKRNLVK